MLNLISQKPFNAELPKPKFLEKNEMYAARVLELAL